MWYFARMPICQMPLLHVLVVNDWGGKILYLTRMPLLSLINTIKIIEAQHRPSLSISVKEINASTKMQLFTLLSLTFASAVIAQGSGPVVQPRIYPSHVIVPPSVITARSHECNRPSSLTLQISKGKYCPLTPLLGPDLRSLMRCRLALHLHLVILLTGVQHCQVIYSSGRPWDATFS